MGRFFAAIGRWFNFVFLRRSENIRRAADEQFTGSTEGIRAAFAIEREGLARDFLNLQGAIAGLLNVVEERKNQLEKLDEEEASLRRRMEGALTAAEQARAAGNTEGYEQAKAAYARYSARVEEIDANQERMTQQVTGLENGMQRHMLRLTQLRARLEQLPQQQAEAMAEFVSAREITDLNNRLMNAQDSLRESPVATVLERVRGMSAQARITEKLVGADAALQDQQYEQAGAASRADDAFEAALAARRQGAGRAGDATAASDRTSSETAPQAAERPEL